MPSMVKKVAWSGDGTRGGRPSRARLGDAGGIDAAGPRRGEPRPRAARRPQRDRSRQLATRDPHSPRSARAHRRRHRGDVNGQLASNRRAFPRMILATTRGETSAARSASTSNGKPRGSESGEVGTMKPSQSAAERGGVLADDVEHVLQVAHHRLETVAAEKARTEDDADAAAPFGHGAQLIVVDVAPVIEGAEDTGVAHQRRTRRHLAGVEEPAPVHVREIDQHAELLAKVDEIESPGREATVAPAASVRRCARLVGAEVEQTEVADSARGERSQLLEIPLERVRPLDAEGARPPLLLSRRRPARPRCAPGAGCRGDGRWPRRARRSAR